MYSSVLLNKVRKVYLISDHIDLDMKGTFWTLVTEFCGSSFNPVFFSGSCFYPLDHVSTSRI